MSDDQSMDEIQLREKSVKAHLPQNCTVQELPVTEISGKDADQIFRLQEGWYCAGERHCAVARQNPIGIFVPAIHPVRVAQIEQILFKLLIAYYVHSLNESLAKT